MSCLPRIEFGTTASTAYEDTIGPLGTVPHLFLRISWSYSSGPLLFTSVWQDADTPAARRNAPTAGVARAAGGGASGEPGDSDGADAAVVDSDEDEEGGWEEVDLPDRNEDIDPEVRPRN